MEGQFSNPISRRTLLGGTAGVAGASLLAGCVGAGPGPQAPGASPAATPSGTGGPQVTLQSNMQDEGPRTALAAVAAGVAGRQVTVNTVATSQFRAQLPTYLTSQPAPDVLTWYGGSVMRSFAKEGLLQDVSQVWQSGNASKLSAALKDLSTFEGKQYFVPTTYYWWGLFHRKSSFEKWGVSAATTWDEFMGMLDKLKTRNIHPLTTGLSNAAWMAAAWFDYLNLRVNGADFHRELLAGRRSFNSDEVRAVMRRYAEILPFFHPDSRSWDAQQAAAPIAREEAGMYLVGTFATAYWPADQQDDLDFFSVPTIDPAVPSAEEAPTDGFMVAANAANAPGGIAVVDHLVGASAQKEFIEKAVSPNLPTNPDVDTSGFTPLVRKGMEMLNSTSQLTQFFNRDSNDELQATADDALMRFINNPSDVDSILANWQTAAEGVFKR